MVPRSRFLPFVVWGLSITVALAQPTESAAPVTGLSADAEVLIESSPQSVDLEAGDPPHLTESPTSDPLVVTAGPDEPTRTEALAALVDTISEARAEIATQRDAFSEALTENQKEQIEAAIRASRNRLNDARFDLLDIATDVDLSGFQAVTEEPLTLQGSIEEMLRPLIDEFKRATKGSREAQKTRERFDTLKQQRDIIGQALATLNDVIAATDEPEIRRELREVRDEWAFRFKELQNDLSVLGFRVDELSVGQRSFFDKARGGVASFFRVRGRNLLIALVAAGLVFVGLRWLEGVIKAKSPLHRGTRTFATRLFNVVFAVLTVLLAVGAAVLVFFLAGDWVMLSLVLLILLGVVFAAKDAIPGYVDDARMLLNLGPVREGERINYHGIPWLVENLTFFTILRNPVLRGGMVRMPVAQLRDYLSRPVHDDEPYFPSEEGDWVLLDDEAYGKVLFQSAEMVRLKLLGGALKMYQTDAYLDQNPRNHSHGFRVKTTIGIDYDEQSKCTTEILEKFRTFFRTEVEKIVDPTDIVSMKIEFALANASSLDYEVLLDLTGEMAPKYYPIQRALQRIGVDACNEFGLSIPFQQITLHQAPGGGLEHPDSK
jgi:small-conductance mechanosensitive channel